MLAPDVIYIAGPMDGYPDHNYPLFHQVARNLREKGFVVYSPAEKSLPTDAPHLAQIDTDIELIVRCDSMLMLPRWWYSRGARTEMEIAKWRNMTILFADRYPELLRSGL